ncbi:hypothetical protein EIN_525310 [Entamoeba invadens IP1]|uniref:Transmembrane protein n=1 Tax=Entamoeba invadens IP1 TaxID=370355 RepID=A0A0A1U8X4_ENTIV|nr:hypothetical protein EIN_525310 [Entamoeba invadens IP1]ELP89576.1 hypothetical protein EIN_525310 [Entamoeba invadens IP1]|eukprot:XP_004256347.1 hypothetical protein EIN_525310 [Entamoeba invadens IP1]
MQTTEPSATIQDDSLVTSQSSEYYNGNAKTSYVPMNTFFVTAENQQQVNVQPIPQQVDQPINYAPPPLNQQLQPQHQENELQQSVPVYLQSTQFPQNGNYPTQGYPIQPQNGIQPQFIVNGDEAMNIDATKKYIEKRTEERNCKITLVFLIIGIIFCPFLVASFVISLRCENKKYRMLGRLAMLLFFLELSASFMFIILSS